MMVEMGGGGGGCQIISRVSLMTRGCVEACQGYSFVKFSANRFSQCREQAWQHTSAMYALLAVQMKGNYKVIS